MSANNQDNSSRNTRKKTKRPYITWLLIVVALLATAWCVYDSRTVGVEKSPGKATVADIGELSVVDFEELLIASRLADQLSEKPLWLPESAENADLVQAADAQQLESVTTPEYAFFVKDIFSQPSVRNAFSAQDADVPAAIIAYTRKVASAYEKVYAALQKGSESKELIWTRAEVLEALSILDDDEGLPAELYLTWLERARRNDLNIGRLYSHYHWAEKFTKSHFMPAIEFLKLQNTNFDPSSTDFERLGSKISATVILLAMVDRRLALGEEGWWSLLGVKSRPKTPLLDAFCNLRSITDSDLQTLVARLSAMRPTVERFKHWIDHDRRILVQVGNTCVVGELSSAGDAVDAEHRASGRFLRDFGILEGKLSSSELETVPKRDGRNVLVALLSDNDIDLPAVGLRIRRGSQSQLTQGESQVEHGVKLQIKSDSAGETLLPTVALDANVEMELIDFPRLVETLTRNFSPSDPDVITPAWVAFPLTAADYQLSKTDTLEFGGLAGSFALKLEANSPKTQLPVWPEWPLLALAKGKAKIDPHSTLEKIKREKHLYSLHGTYSPDVSTQIQDYIKQHISDKLSQLRKQLRSHADNGEGAFTLSVESRQISLSADGTFRLFESGNLDEQWQGSVVDGRVTTQIPNISLSVLEQVTDLPKSRTDLQIELIPVLGIELVDDLRDHVKEAAAPDFLSNETRLAEELAQSLAKEEREDRESTAAQLRHFIAQIALNSVTAGPVSLSVSSVAETQGSQTVIKIESAPFLARRIETFVSQVENRAADIAVLGAVTPQPAVDTVAELSSDGQRAWKLQVYQAIFEHLVKRTLADVAGEPTVDAEQEVARLTNEVNQVLQTPNSNVVEQITQLKAAWFKLEQLTAHKAERSHVSEFVTVRDAVATFLRLEDVVANEAASDLDEDAILEVVEQILSQTVEHHGSFCAIVPPLNADDPLGEQPRMLVNWRPWDRLFRAQGSTERDNNRLTVVSSRISTAGQFAYPGRTFDLGKVWGLEAGKLTMTIESVGPRGAVPLTLSGTGDLDVTDSRRLEQLSKEIFLHAVITKLEWTGEEQQRWSVRLVTKRAGDSTDFKLLPLGFPTLEEQPHVDFTMRVMQGLANANSQFSNSALTAMAVCGTPAIQWDDFRQHGILIGVTFDRAKLAELSTENLKLAPLLAIEERPIVQVIADSDAINAQLAKLEEQVTEARQRLLNAFSFPDWISVQDSGELELQLNGLPLKLPVSLTEGYSPDDGLNSLSLDLRGKVTTESIDPLIDGLGIGLSVDGPAEYRVVANGVASPNGKTGKPSFEILLNVPCSIQSQIGTGRRLSVPIQFALPSLTDDPGPYLRRDVSTALREYFIQEVKAVLATLPPVETASLQFASDGSALNFADRSPAQWLIGLDTLLQPDDGQIAFEAIRPQFEEYLGQIQWTENIPELTQQAIDDPASFIRAQIEPELRKRIPSQLSLSATGRCDLPLGLGTANITATGTWHDGKLDFEYELTVAVDQDQQAKLLENLEQKLDPLQEWIQTNADKSDIEIVLLPSAQAPEQVQFTFHALKVVDTPLALVVSKSGAISIGDECRTQVLTKILTTGTAKLDEGVAKLNLVVSSTLAAQATLKLGKGSIVAGRLTHELTFDGETVGELYIEVDLGGVRLPGEAEWQEIGRNILAKIEDRVVDSLTDDILAKLPKLITVCGIELEVIPKAANPSPDWLASFAARANKNGQDLILSNIGVKNGTAEFDFSKVTVEGSLAENLLPMLDANLTTSFLGCTVGLTKASLERNDDSIPGIVVVGEGVATVTLSDETQVSIKFSNIRISTTGGFNFGSVRIAPADVDKLARFLEGKTNDLGLPSLGIEFRNSKWLEEQSQFETETYLTKEFFKKLPFEGLSSTDEIHLGKLTVAYQDGNFDISFEGGNVEAVISQVLSQELKKQLQKHSPLSIGDSAKVYLDDLSLNKQRLVLNVRAVYEGELPLTMAGSLTVYFDGRDVKFDLKPDETLQAALKKYLTSLVPDNPFFKLDVHDFDPQTRAIKFGFQSQFFGMKIGMDNILFKQGRISFPDGPIITFGTPLRVQLGTTPLMLIKPAGTMNLKTKDVSIQVQITLSGVGTEYLVDVLGRISTNLARPTRFEVLGQLRVLGTFPLGESTVIVDLDERNLFLSMNVGVPAVINIHGETEFQFPGANKPWFARLDGGLTIIDFEVSTITARLDANGVFAETKVDYLLVTARAGFASDLRMSNPTLGLGAKLDLEIAATEVGVDANLNQTAVFVDADAELVSITIDFTIPSWAALNPGLVAAKIAAALKPTGLELGNPKDFHLAPPKIQISGGKVKLFGKKGKKGKKSKGKNGGKSSSKSAENAKAAANPPAKNSQQQAQQSNAVNAHAQQAINAANTAGHPSQSQTPGENQNPTAENKEGEQSKPVDPKQAAQKAKTAAKEAKDLATAVKQNSIPQNAKQQANQAVEQAKTAADSADELSQSIEDIDLAADAMVNLVGTLETQRERINKRLDELKNQTDQESISAKETLETLLKENRELTEAAIAKADELREQIDDAKSDLQSAIKDKYEARAAAREAEQELLAKIQETLPPERKLLPLEDQESVPEGEVTASDTDKPNKPSTGSEENVTETAEGGKKPQPPQPPESMVDVRKNIATIRGKMSQQLRIEIGGEGLGENSLVLSSTAYLERFLEEPGPSRVREFLDSESGKNFLQVLGDSLQSTQVTVQPDSGQPFQEWVLTLELPAGDETVAKVYEHAFVLEAIAQLYRNAQGSVGQGQAKLKLNGLVERLIQRSKTGEFDLNALDVDNATELEGKMEFEVLREVLSRLLRALWRGQGRDGGWNYRPWIDGFNSPSSSSRPDMSLAQAALFGLRSALQQPDDVTKRGGIDEDIVEQSFCDLNGAPKAASAEKNLLNTFTRARAYVDQSRRENGEFRMSKDDTDFIAAAVLVWCPLRDAGKVWETPIEPSEEKTRGLILQMLSKNEKLFAKADPQASPPKAGFLFHYQMLYTVRALDTYVNQLDELSEADKKTCEAIRVWTLDAAQLYKELQTNQFQSASEFGSVKGGGHLATALVTYASLAELIERIDSKLE